MNALLKVVLLFVLALFSTGLLAQSFPSKPIRMVIGFPPGGSIDIVARILAAKLSESFRQEVIVDNRPGANGIIGMGLVANASPDGYTTFFGTTGNLSVNPTLYPDLPFNVGRDFIPLTQTSSVPFLNYVNPFVSVRTLGELIAYAKANPGKLSFYSAGTGSLTHLSGELLNRAALINTVHVPYKGGNQGITGLIGGHVQFSFDAVPIGLQHVKTGKLRAIATTAPNRLSILPDVPAANETLPGFEIVNWYGIVLPSGTPRKVVTYLHAEIVRAMNNPDVREKLIAQGAYPVGSAPEEFSAFMKAETIKWGRVVTEANVSSY